MERIESIMNKNAKADALSVVMAILMVVLIIWLIKMRITGGA